MFIAKRRAAEAQQQAEEQAHLQPEQEQDPTQPLPAIALINRALSSDELLPLPGVGKGAAKLIFDRRPESGYGFTEQIAEFAPEVLKHPYKLDLEAIAQWSPE